MSFRPNTLYTVFTANNVAQTPRDLESLYQAVKIARDLPNGNGATVRNSAGTTVFTRNNDQNTFHLYQFNNYNNTSATYNPGQLLPGASNDNLGKMRTWLNNFAYSSSIDGRGYLANSRIRFFHRHNFSSINGIYGKQELASGGYYSVQTLNSTFNNDGNNIAANTSRFQCYGVKLKIDNINSITQNLFGVRDSNPNNAYIFVGINAGSRMCEFGLQRRNNGWFAFRMSSFKGWEANLVTSAISMPANASVVIQLERSAQGVLTASIKVNNTDVNFTNPDQPASFTDATFSDTTNATNAGGTSGYRSVSFVPPDTNPAQSNFNPTPDLNDKSFFKDIKLSNFEVKRGTSSTVAYIEWPFNAVFNEWAVAFNEEFIQVGPGNPGPSATEENVSISYYGRDTNSNLQFWT